MNDAEELIHALDLFEEVVTVALNNDDSRRRDGHSEFLHGLLKWIERQRDDTDHHLYVFSLSEVPSLLSQWRSYTPHGKGVSIGFSPDLLKELTKDRSFRLGKCLYEIEEKLTLFGSLINKLWITCSHQQRDEYPNEVYPSRFTALVDRYADSVFPVLALAKHEAFAEEAEWRLISRHFTSLDNARFREGASMLVPYLPLSLKRKDEVFESVLLGPTPHEQLSLPALKAFLKSEKLTATVKSTRIPYRVW